MSKQSKPLEYSWSTKILSSTSNSKAQTNAQQTKSKQISDKSEIDFTKYKAVYNQVYEETPSQVLPLLNNSSLKPNTLLKLKTITNTIQTNTINSLYNEYSITTANEIKDVFLTSYPALPPAVPPAVPPALPPAFSSALPSPPYSTAVNNAKKNAVNNAKKNAVKYAKHNSKLNSKINPVNHESHRIPTNAEMVEKEVSAIAIVYKEFLKAKGALPSIPTTPNIPNALFSNENCLVALIDLYLSVIFTGSQYVKTNQSTGQQEYNFTQCNPGFVELLKRLKTNSKLNSPTVVFNRILQGNSANALFTTCTVASVERKQPNAELETQTRNYFIKVQIRNDRDNLTVDNLIGFILTNCITNSCYFSEYIDCFVSKIGGLGNPLAKMLTFDPHVQLQETGAYYRKVNVQRNLDGYISLSDFFKEMRGPRNANADRISKFLRDFHYFCFNTIKMSRDNGFVHNDAHLGNIFYNKSIQAPQTFIPDQNPVPATAPIVMIDYGRVRFLPGFLAALDSVSQYHTQLESICAKSFEQVKFWNTFKNPSHKWVEESQYSFFFDIATMSMNILRNSPEIQKRVCILMEEVLKTERNGTEPKIKVEIDFTNLLRIKLPHYKLLEECLLKFYDKFILELHNQHLTFIFIGMLWFIYAASDFGIEYTNQRIVFYEEDSQQTQTFHMDLLHKCNFIAAGAYQFIDVRINEHFELIDNLVTTIWYLLPEDLITTDQPTSGGRRGRKGGAFTGSQSGTTGARTGARTTGARTPVTHPPSALPRPSSALPRSSSALPRPPSAFLGKSVQPPKTSASQLSAIPKPSDFLTNFIRRNVLRNAPKIEKPNVTALQTEPVMTFTNPVYISHYDTICKYISMLENKDKNIDPDDLIIHYSPPNPPDGYNNAVREILKEYTVGIYRGLSIKNTLPNIITQLALNYETSTYKTTFKNPLQTPVSVKTPKTSKELNDYITLIKIPTPPAPSSP